MRSLSSLMFSMVMTVLATGCGGSSFTAAGGGSDSGASADGSAGDGSSDSGVLRADAASVDAVASDARDEAGIPCASADINHPGSEPRTVGTAVPFVGRARDQQCAPILGNKLVWTDNLEGQIGTGETFAFTFTTLGSHTVTLTATAQGRTYTASVTFMIVA